MKKLIVMLAVLLMAVNVLGFVSVPLDRMENAVYVYPPGTDSGQTLQNAYDYITSSDRDAAMGTLGVLNQRTIVLTAGAYTSTAFVFDTNYVNLYGIGDVTITDTSGAVIDCGNTIAKISNIRIDAASEAVALTKDESVVLDNVQITDGTYFINVSNNTYSKSVSVTSAELLALNATPKTLVPAQGTGVVVEFLSAMMFLDYNSAAYDTQNGILGIYETDESGTLLTTTAVLADFLGKTADTFQYMPPLSADTGFNDNVPIVLGMPAGETLNGDSPITVVVSYRIHNFN